MFRPYSVVIVLCWSFVANAQTAFLDEEKKNAQQQALTSADPLLATGGVARALALLEHDEDFGARDAFVDAVVAKAKSPLARAMAQRQRAVDRANGGDFKGADDDLDALGHPRMLRCVGPFANNGGGAFGSDVAASDVAATVDVAVPGLDRPVRWREVPRDARGGFDVGSRFVARREIRALCAVVVDVPKAMGAALRLGSSGQLRVLVNGAEVLKEDRDRPMGFDQSAALVSLAKGKNLVVVELGVFARAGSVDLRLTAPDGAPLKATWSTATKDLQATKTTKPQKATTETLAQAQTTSTGDLDHLRASIALASRNRAFDERARPTEIQQLLSMLVEKAASKAEKASAEVRFGSEIEDRDRSAARSFYEAAAVDDPLSASALSSLGRLRADLGDEAEASRLFARAVSLAPSSVLYRAERWDFERRRQVLGVAVDQEILQAAQKTSSTRLLRLAADVADDRGDHARALAYLERGKKRDVAAWAVAAGEVDNARLAADEKARAELLSTLKLRLRLTPASHSLAERVLQHLIDSGDKVAVAAFVDDRKDLFPDRPEPLVLAARDALIRGERARAKALLAEAQERAPEDADLQKVARALDDGAAKEDALAVYAAAVDADAARKDVPARAKELGAHVQSRTLATRFFENGQLRSIEDTVVVVHDAKKAQGFRAFSYSYSGGREDLEVLVAERISKDGRKEPAARILDRGQDGKENGAYSDARVKSAVFAGVDDGDVFHVRVRKVATGLQNLFGDFYGDIEPFQGRYPINHFRYVVEAPLTRPLSWGGRGAPEPVVTEKDGLRVYDFAADAVAGIEGEPGMPPWLEIARYLSVSTYKNWGDLGLWYEDLIRDQLRLDDELKKLAAELKKASTNEEDLIRRTYETVVGQTRYVGIELGIHGWKPYPVSEIYRRRFGDCKDKASLLVSLLRQNGVEAHLALVRTIQLGHEATAPPSMWAFNHAIAYVPKLDLFLDGTAEQSGWKELPTMDQGAVSLVVDGAKSRIVTIPVHAADDNLNTSDYVLTLQPDGALVVNGTERFHGQHNAQERRTFADPATRRETLERQLSQSINGAAVKKIDVSDLGLDKDEIHYTFNAALPRRAAVADDGTLTLPVSLYPHDLSGNYAEQSTRGYELFFDHPWRTRNVMRYVLPRGFVVDDLPKGGVVDGPHIKFKQTITRTEDGFIVDEDTAIVVRRVPAADYARFRKDALAADALMKRNLRIVKKGAT